MVGSTNSLLELALVRSDLALNTCAILSFFPAMAAQNLTHEAVHTLLAEDRQRFIDESATLRQLESFEAAADSISEQRFVLQTILTQLRYLLEILGVAPLVQENTGLLQVARGAVDTDRWREHFTSVVASVESPIWLEQVGDLMQIGASGKDGSMKTGTATKRSRQALTKALSRTTTYPSGTLQMPPDGLCLSHALYAARNPKQWLKIEGGRDPDGTARLAGKQRKDQRHARTILDEVVGRMLSLGLDEQAERLTRAGSAGFPGDEDLPFFAQVVGGTIQVVPLTLGEFQAPAAFGTGPLYATVGHVLLPSGAGHFVLLDCPEMPDSSSSSSSSSKAPKRQKKTRSKEAPGGA
jgi:hypothetical protein